MSKKGCPKSIDTIEVNIVKLKHDIKIARIFLFGFTGAAILFFVFVQFSSMGDSLFENPRVMIIISMVVFMVILIASGVTGNYLKIKKEKLRDQEDFLAHAKKQSARR